MRAVLAARVAATLGTAVFVACNSGDTGDPSRPATAGIRVTVATEGSAPDPDGYTLSVDGGPAQRVSANATVSLDDLAAGSHRLAIDDLAANCRVTGERERTVTVEGGQTAGVDFSLVCAARSGTVRVEVVTSGPDTDSDGYMVSLSGAQPARVLANAWIEIGVGEGERSVVVTGVAPNCAAGPNNPSTVSVLANQAVALRLEFTCTAITGAVDVVIVSTGGSIDPDGYQLEAEWLAQPFQIGVNGTVAFSQIKPGNRSITLSGVQANCQVEGGPTRTVTVIAAGTVQIRLVVRCTVFARLTVSTTTTMDGFPPGLTPPAPPGFLVRVAYDNSGFTTPVSSNGSVTIELPFAGEYRLSVGQGYCSSADQTIVIDTEDVAVTFAVTCRSRRVQP